MRDRPVGASADEQPAAHPQTVHLASMSTFPSTAANSVQVIHVANALTDLGWEVTLHGFRGDGFCEGTTWRDYGLRAQLQPLLRPGSQNRVVRLWSLLRTAVAVWRTRPDLTYTRNPLIAVLTRRGRRGKLCEIHQVPRPGSAMGVLMRLMTWQPGKTLLVFITEAVQRDTNARFPRARRLPQLVAPSGVDVEAFSTADPTYPRPPGSALRVGYVGSLYEGRGVDVILACARRLPEHEFLVVGGTDEQWELVTSQGVPENLRRLPHQPAVAVPGILRSCDVLLAPYQEQVRAFGDAGDISGWMSPLKIFEYMGSGRAIIASRLPVLSEVLSDGHNATLAPHDDLEAWVQAIINLSQDEDRRLRLGRQAQLDAADKFSWKQRTAHILEALV